MLADNGHICCADSNPYAVADDEGGGADGAADGLFAAPVPSQLQLEAPPFEDQLMQSTLWAEVEKLYDACDGTTRQCSGIHTDWFSRLNASGCGRYGHPSEIITVAVNRAGTLAASACRVRTAHKTAVVAMTITH